MIDASKSKAYLKCEEALKKALEHKKVKYGPFSANLKRLVEEQIDRKCRITRADYGLIEFIVSCIHFKLVIPPTISQVQLLYRHLEADSRFHNSNLDYEPTILDSIVSSIGYHAIEDIVSPISQ